MDLCIQCSHPVRPRQEGLECDVCSRWQHRTCNTGITQREYRAAVREGHNIAWSCQPCTNNNNLADADTPNSDDNSDIEGK